MKFKSLLVACVVMLGVNSAEATIIEHGSYFTDTSSGLDWLNNAPLAGQSYNSVLNGYGGYTNSGWRYATGAELSALVYTYVSHNPPLGANDETTASAYDYSLEAFIASQYMIKLLGIEVSMGSPPDPTAVVPLYSTSVTGVWSQGMYDDESGHLKESVFVLLAADFPQFAPVPYSASVFVNDNMSVDAIAPNISSFLVRSDAAPVPEPSTMLLFGIGVVGYVLYRRRITAN